MAYKVWVAGDQPTSSDLNQNFLLATAYGVDSGSNDTYAITLTPALAGYVNGQSICFKANTINTGACTLNVNGLGAKSIYKKINTALSDGDIQAGQLVTVVYDGTNFILQNDSHFNFISHTTGTSSIDVPLGTKFIMINTVSSFTYGTSYADLSLSLDKLTAYLTIPYQQLSSVAITTITATWTLGTAKLEIGGATTTDIYFYS